MHTQLAVLGGGPGGYGAAFLAADQGVQVTIVEAQASLGGTCLLQGCIPSKALLHVARVMSDAAELGSDWGIEFSPPVIQIQQLRAGKEKLISTLSKGLMQLAKRRNVTLINARGMLENSTTLVLQGDDPSIPEGGRLTFDHLVLATGSSPSMPASLAIDSDQVVDSTGALALRDIPESLLVVGGGYIGLEMATVYAQLGSKVSIVELTSGLLPGVDRDLIKPLQRRLEKLCDKRIFLDTKVLSLTEHEQSVEATLEGPDQTRAERFQRVLIAVGRQPNSSGLGLENTEVQLDSRGFIVCDDQQRTADRHILAIGDVAGEPMLAHKATHQGKVAVATLLGKAASEPPRAIPAVVFTDPEIAWVGLTQDQAKQAGTEVQVAIYPWAASGRAHAIGRTDGLTKWIVEPQTERLLGCGIVGCGAGELIAEAVLAIESQCRLSQITQAIHPHPTLSETLAGAGEVFYGTATEIYKPKRR